MTASFRRTPQFDRRSDMIEATLDCIVEFGIENTTVRAVATRAGVSNGLIRHHFTSKDNLIVEAYRRIISMMTGPALDVLASHDGPPRERLARFIVASLSGPVADPRMLSLWATFVSKVYRNRDLAREHRQGYLAYRDATEELIVEVLHSEGRTLHEGERRRLSIAFNALIDGLWLECGLSAAEFDGGLQVDIGFETVEKLLGIALPKPDQTKEN